MPECRLCRYKFVKQIKNGTVIITLIETKTEKEVGYMRFSDEPDYIELEYIVVHIEEKGFGSKLVRVIKAIAKRTNKPIYLDAYSHTVGFWKKHDFIDLELRGMPDGLVRMAWKAKSF